MVPYQTSVVIISLCLFVLAPEASETKRRSYHGYSVLRLHPMTDNQLDKLRDLMLNADDSGSIQFWTEPIALNKSVDVAIDSNSREEFMGLLKDYKISHETMIHNLEREINKSIPKRTMSRLGMSNSTLRAQYFAPDNYYRQYHPYAEIEVKLRELERMDPRVTVEVIGESGQNRNLYLVRVSSDPSAGKPVILMDAGHHAREWISHATIIYVIESLVNIDVPRMKAFDHDGYRQFGPKIKLDLDNYDYWFVPVVNPDGYEYTHTTDRLWRKTRSSGYCAGADPNRNYAFHWREVGASSFPCHDTYAGPRPFSEPETRAVASVMDQYKNQIVMYVSFHSYSQVILSPYGYARVYPHNYDELERVAEGWISSIRRLRGTDYEFGTSAIKLYPAAGASDDYAHGVAMIRFAYTIELPDKGRRGFILPPSEIIPVGQETVMGLKSMIDIMTTIQGY